MIKRICFVLAMILIIGSIILSFILGSSINNILGFTLGMFFLILSWIYDVVASWLRTAINVFLILIVAFVTMLLGLMYRDGSNNTASFDEDILIILGSGIRGEELTPMLKSRLDTALEYLDENPYAVVIVSGGQGYGEDIPEATAMKRYLVSKGIDSGQIVEEEFSRNTYENLLNAKEIIDGKGYSVVIVTTDFHMYRTLKIAEKCGIEAKSYNAPLNWYLRPGSTLREIVSILKFWLKK